MKATTASSRWCTTTLVELERERLREISRRLLRLHRMLLERERHAYETRHGAVSSGDLLRLLLEDEHFAWLRPLSTLIAQMDEVVDMDEPLAPSDAQKAFREVYRLLKSGESGAFQEKYRQALQDSPDVVMAHADVSSVLPAPKGETRPS
jgi:hypothetical protein